MAAHPVAVHAGARPPGSAAGQPGEAAGPTSGPAALPARPAPAGAPRSFPLPSDLPEVIIVAGRWQRAPSLPPRAPAQGASCGQGAGPPPSAWRERGGGGARACPSSRPVAGGGASPAPQAPPGGVGSRARRGLSAGTAG